MERRRVGLTGAEVGALGLGTSSWGHATDVADAGEQVDMLVAAGGDFVDLDGRDIDLRFVAEAVTHRGRREQVFLSVRSGHAWSRRGILAEIDEALASLDVDHVDLWSLQGWDATRPWEEIVSALAVAVASGRARYVGIAPDHAWQAGLVGGALGMHPQRAPLAAATVPYSLLDRRRAEAVASACGVLGAGMVATSALAGGVLTGKYRHATPPDSRGAGERDGGRLQAYRGAWSRPVIDGLVAAAEGLAATPGALALAWVRERPGVSCTVVGARTVHQWRAALGSLDVRIPDEIAWALDEVSTQAAGLGDHGPRAAPHEGRADT